MRPAFVRLFGSPLIMGNVIKVSFVASNKIAVMLNKIIIAVMSNFHTSNIVGFKQMKRDIFICFPDVLHTSIALACSWVSFAALGTLVSC
jgi:hypothetical protein